MSLSVLSNFRSASCAYLKELSYAFVAWQIFYGHLYEGAISLAMGLPSVCKVSIPPTGAILTFSMLQSGSHLGNNNN